VKLVICWEGVGLWTSLNHKSLDGKENEEPTKLAPPSYPRRNCPTKKNPDFLWV